MKRIIITAAIISLSFLPIISQNVDLTNELRAELQNTLFGRLPNSHGLSAAISFPDGNIWTGVRGYSHGDYMIDSTTLFTAGSLSKHLVGPMVVSLSEHGYFNLDDSIYHWVPKINNIDSTITLRQLLTHTSGLPWNIPWPETLGSNPDSIYQPYDILQRIGTPAFEPGTSVSYSNLAYNLLCLVVDSACHQPIEKVLRDQVLNPFNLDHTFFWPFEDYQGQVAHQWDGNTDETRYFNPTTMSWGKGAGNLLSTPYDAVKWSRVLMTGGYLNEENTMDIKTPQTDPFMMGPGYFPRFSYGTMISEDVEVRHSDPISLVGHSGQAFFSISQTAYIPETDISIAVFCNDASAVGNMIFHLYETLLSGKANVDILVDQQQEFNITSGYSQGEIVDTIEINMDEYDYSEVKFKVSNLGPLGDKAFSLDEESGILRVKDAELLQGRDYLLFYFQTYPIDSMWYLVETGKVVINIQQEDNIRTKMHHMFSIYPNPSTSLLTIKTDNPDCYSLEIHSLNGQLIYKEEMEGNSKQIDMSPFSKGVYFITIRSKEGVRTEKVVKY